MLKWLQTYDEFMALDNDHIEESEKYKNLLDEENQLRDNLLKELKAIGTDIKPIKDDQLYHILELATQEVQNCERIEQNKSDLKSNLETININIQNRQRELNNAEAVWTNWQNEWSDLLNEIGLSSNLKIDEINIQIESIEEMRTIAASIDDITFNRINKIERDISIFESNVKEIVEAVAKDLSSIKAEDAVLKIEERLKKSKEIYNLRKQKEGLIKSLESDKAEIENDYKEELQTIDQLKDKVSTDSIDVLKEEINKSNKLRLLKDELKDTLENLKNIGDHFTFEELKQQCDGIQIDNIAAQEETIRNELTELHKQMNLAIEQRTNAKISLQSVGGDNAAAKAEAIRQEALAEIQDVANQYVRVRASVILLQWAIDQFLQEKQGPLVKSAGNLFSKITKDSFIGLNVRYDDKDQAYLIGNRSNGDNVKIDGMSGGTRDQLYLALRLAFVGDYLDQANALPFIADDLFINFDNDRAAAGFRVLADLAEKTQVLFFTHHEHLVEIAKQELGKDLSVISLYQ